MKSLYWLIQNPYAGEENNGFDYSILQKFELFIISVMNFLISYLAYFILIGLVLMTGLDIFFMLCPPYTRFVKKVGLDGSRDDLRFHIISRSCIDAVQEASVTNRNKIVIYLRKRVVTYIISSIVVLIMLVGAPFIAQILDKLTRGIKEALGL